MGVVEHDIIPQMPAKHKSIYLDYGATTPLDARVLEAMHPYFGQDFGNPASVHSFGQKAETALEKARLSIARALKTQPGEVIFTSGGTESDNLALRGTAFAARKAREAKHILIAAGEHDAIARTAQQLSDVDGFEVERIPINAFGQVEPAEVAKRLRADSAIVSVMMASNEVGSINPITEIAAICRERGIPLHSDAVQGGAYLPVDVQELGVDLLSLGAHKFYGPKGIGVLYCREGTNLLPTQSGGSHEFGLRAGTPNLPYIVGMARAFEIVQNELDERAAKLIGLRDRVIEGVLEDVPDAKLSGHPEQRLPNHASFVFKGVDGNTLLMLLDSAGFACSSGSACKTGNPEPSEVLQAMGFTPEWALGSLRVTTGIHTQPEEIEAFLAALPELVEKARALELA